MKVLQYTTNTNVCMYLLSCGLFWRPFYDNTVIPEINVIFINANFASEFANALFRMTFLKHVNYMYLTTY